MNYTKPEVTVLGEAAHVIEQFPQVKPVGTIIEVPRGFYLNPAYDLDE